jgi:hypothetical protein
MKKFFLFFGLLCSLCALAQPPSYSTLFEKRWGDGRNNVLEYGDELADGGFLFVGMKRETNNPVWEIYVCRTDAYGNLIWERRFGVPDQDDVMTYILKTSDGRYLIIGGSTNVVQIGSDVFAFRIDASGYVDFYNHYYLNTGYSDFPGAACETPDHGFIISCALGVLPQNQHSPTIIKINQAGNEIWRYRLDSLVEYQPRKIAATPDGGCIVAGYANQQVYGNPYLTKHAANGQLEWINYPYGLNDTLTASPVEIFVNADGSFNVPFREQVGTSNYIITKWIDYAATGILLDSTYLPFGVNFPFKSNTAFDANTSTYFTSFKPNPYTSPRYHKIDRDRNITMLFAADFDSLIQAAHSFYILPTKDGGYMGVGTYGQLPNPGSYFSCVKFGPTGRSVAYSFEQTVAAHPNPSVDGVFNLTFDMAADGDVRIDVFSIDGKPVFKDQFFCLAHTQNSYPVRLDLRSCGAGFYILQVRSGEQLYQRTLVVLEGKEN